MPCAAAPALDSDCLNVAIIAESISSAAFGDPGNRKRSTKSRHVCCAPASSCSMRVVTAFVRRRLPSETLPLIGWCKPVRAALRL
ncbi:hypothetical protein BGX38DRAFT_1241506 [Terfezia claveryi]|nr:hypothetical protein BGX38DRAFT_1241506 [Terfezia claveryi]